MLIRSNARFIPLKDKSVQMICTSPPYYGLRDYGTSRWEGGDPECDHKMRSGSERANGGVIGAGIRCRDGVAGLTRDYCKCGARRIDAQLGRIGIGLDLAYQDLAIQRIGGPLFAKVINSI